MGAVARSSPGGALVGTPAARVVRRAACASPVNEGGLLDADLTADMDGWEEIADDALNWALEHSAAGASAEPAPAAP